MATPRQPEGVACYVVWFFGAGFGCVWYIIFHDLCQDILFCVWEWVLWLIYVGVVPCFECSMLCNYLCCVLVLIGVIFCHWLRDCFRCVFSFVIGLVYVPYCIVFPISSHTYLWAAPRDLPLMSHPHCYLMSYVGFVFPTHTLWLPVYCPSSPPPYVSPLRPSIWHHQHNYIDPTHPQ